METTKVKISYGSRSYWRVIKIGYFKYADINSQSMKKQVECLAKLEVEAGTITTEKYKELIGEDYTPLDVEIEL